jgi:endonuclease III
MKPFSILIIIILSQQKKKKKMDSIISKSEIDFRAAVALRESIPGFMKNAAEECINKLVEEKWLCNDVRLNRG